MQNPASHWDEPSGDGLCNTIRAPDGVHSMSPRFFRNTFRTAIFILLLACTALPAQDLDLEIGGDDEPVDLVADPQIIFYLPLDGNTIGLTPEYRITSLTKDYDQALAMEFGDGVVGKAVVVYGWHCLTYPTEDVLDRRKGSLSFWYKCKPKTELGKDAAIVDGALAFPDVSILNVGDGKWHHWVITWNAEKHHKLIYLDGKVVVTTQLSGPIGGTMVRFGRGCPGALDELYIFDRPLPEDAIADAFARTSKGKVSWPEGKDLAPAEGRYPVSMDASKQRRPRLPASISWDLKEEARTSTRARYSLDGRWRVQPFGTKMSLPTLGEVGKKKRRLVSLAPQPGAWAFAEFPGSWRTHGNLNRLGGLLAPDGSRRLSTWKNVDLSFYPAAWLERDFELKGVPAGSGVFLVMDGVHDDYGCDVHVNDRFVGSARQWQQEEYNISQAVNLDGRNRIDIMAGKPYGPYSYRDRWGGTVWLPSGMCLSVHLEVRKARDIAFRDVIPIPSFRKKQLGVEFWIDNPTGVKRTLSAACKLVSTRTGETVSLPPISLDLTGAKEEMKLLEFPWEDPILWSPDDPHLLNLSLIIRDGEELIDETTPIRFGFREIWQEDGYLWMNGARFWMHGQCHSIHGGTKASVVENIRRLGLVGMRSSIAYFLGRSSMPPRDTEITLNVADEKGFLLIFKVYGGGTTREGLRRSLRDYFKQFRSHPCVACYTKLRYGYHGPAHGSPISMGRLVEEKEKELPAYRRDQDLVDLCREVNPAGLMAYYQQGVVGDYRSYMQYLGYGTPIQTREEWPRYWAQTRPAPFVGCELDMCLSLFMWKWQNGYRSGTPPFEQGVEPHCTEHAARYFGDEAYAKETAETVNAIRAHLDKEEAYPIYDVPNSVDLLAKVVKRTTRAWRTYGISYLIHDETRISYREDLTLSNADQAYRDGNAWFLAYIGGTKGDFVRKDHAFFSGEKIDKQIIIVNSRFHPVPVKAQLRLVHRDTGKSVESFSQEFVVRAGDILKYPFTLQAPEVQGKTAYRIELEAVEDGGTTKDEFGVEVFPSAARPDLDGARILLIDETGDTAGLLTEAGVAFARLDMAKQAETWEDAAAGSALLIIGRQSLPEDPSMQQRVFNLAANGANILCFEQTTKQVLGLRNDDPNTRYAFIAAADHPVVRGLSDEDFRNWRGASNILEPYPDYRKGIEYGRLEHKRARGFFGQCEFAHWSSNGTIASFHFEKPQVGSFKAILSSGFDMLYTPLIELNVGRGRIMLCQLDVTNRYGRDPVATLVVNRLLKHGASRKRETASEIMWWGSSYWDKVLKELHVRSREAKTLEDLADASVVLLGIDTFPVRKPPKKQTAAMRAESEAEASSEVKLVPPKAGEAEDETGEEIEELIEEDEAQEAAAAAARRSLPPEIEERITRLQAHKSSLAGFLKRGGTLVVPYVASEDHVEWLPLQVNVEEREVFNASTEGIRELSGLTASDFYFREVLKMPVISALPPGSALQESGFVGVAPYGKGKVVFCQLYPEHFQNAWQRTKMLRLWATLLTNLGVATAEAEPEADLSRLFYAAPALDFNPDKHRSW